MRSSPTHTLLSLFSTPQRAEEIEGDLLEASETRGRTWFAYHVASVTLALFKESCKEAPLRLALLTVPATGFTFALIMLLDRVFFAPHAVVPIPFAGLLAVVVSAFVTGLSLSRFGSRLGT